MVDRAPLVVAAVGQHLLAELAPEQVAPLLREPVVAEGEAAEDERPRVADHVVPEHVVLDVRGQERELAPERVDHLRGLELRPQAHRRDPVAGAGGDDVRVARVRIRRRLADLEVVVVERVEAAEALRPGLDPGRRERPRAPELERALQRGEAALRRAPGAAAVDGPERPGRELARPRPPERREVEPDAHASASR